MSEQSAAAVASFNKPDPIEIELSADQFQKYSVALNISIVDAPTNPIDASFVKSKTRMIGLLEIARKDGDKTDQQSKSKLDALIKLKDMNCKNCLISSKILCKCNVSKIALSKLYSKYYNFIELDAPFYKRRFGNSNSEYHSIEIDKSNEKIFQIL